MSFSRSHTLPNFARWSNVPSAPSRIHPQGNTAAKRLWDERGLKEAIGVTTTNKANPPDDFEKAMDHFEAIAGDSIEWQLRMFSGDACRILHEIRNLCRNFDIAEGYARHRPPGAQARLVTRPSAPSTPSR